MGKKRPEEPEESEGYEFLPPDFDEDAFIHKEMVSFRTTLTLFVVGILAAVVSWGLFIAVDGAKVGWLIGMAVFAVFFALLKPLYKALKLDISHYKRREWIGSAFLLFFTWLAFWLILINPPVSDFAEPDVAVYASPGVVDPSGEVRIDVFYTDNDAVATRGFTVTGPDGTVVADEADLDRLEGPHHQYVATGLATGTYTVTATGTDDGGRTGETNTTFEVRAEAMEVVVGDLTDPTATVFVRVAMDPASVYAVYLDVEGQDRHVFLEYEERVGGWTATRNFEGWQEGNNTFTVVVEQKNRFEGQTLVRGGTLRSDATHTVEVSEPGDYEGSVPKRANPTAAPSREVPGPALPLVVAGLLVVAFVVRRRRQ